MSKLVPALLGLVTAGLVAGCGDNPFPRVDFPTTPGNYVQFYRDGMATKVELAVVDTSGKISTVIGDVKDKILLERPIQHAQTSFEHCGLALFNQPDHAKDLTTSSNMRVSEVAFQKCPFRPMPVLWTRIGAAK